MSRNPTQSSKGGASERNPEQFARRIRLAIIGVIVAFVAIFAFVLVRTMQDDAARERWDVLEALRTEHEPNTDPLWRNPFGVYNPERLKFIGSLEKFLDQKAAEEDDALAPHTRYMLAKTITDHLLSNPGLLDQKERGEFYKKAVDQLEALRDDYPDFPLNWSVLSEEGFPTLTRQFLSWLETNEAWEKKHMLRAAEPDAGLRVLVRTDRGDMLMGLYREGAPLWTAAFVERAVNGQYDGTYFSMKTEIGDVAEPEVHTVMAGGESTRGLKPYDMDSAMEAAEVEARSGLLPEEIRNRIPQDRGIVCAWHAEGETYDHEARFLVLARRSPRMDYDYTPIGKLVEENGVGSLLTLDRIFGADVWQKDAKVREDTEKRPILDYLQVPVLIRKVLVYRDGVLQQPGEGALVSKAKIEEGEEKLSSVTSDAYKQDPPARPSDEPEKGEEPGDDEEVDPLPPLDDKNGDDE